MDEQADSRIWIPIPIFMIHAFPICVLHISLGPFSENERAGRMAEGKVEDKRFLVPPVAHDCLTGSLLFESSS